MAETSNESEVRYDDLPGFFAWARPRVYPLYDERMKLDPKADPNWTFSEIMQELLAEYASSHPITDTASQSSIPPSES